MFFSHCPEREQDFRHSPNMCRLLHPNPLTTRHARRYECVGFRKGYRFAGIVISIISVFAVINRQKLFDDSILLTTGQHEKVINSGSQDIADAQFTVNQFGLGMGIETADREQHDEVVPEKLGQASGETKEVVGTHAIKSVEDNADQSISKENGANEDSARSTGEMGVVERESQIKFDFTAGEKLFFDTAKSLTPTTDKVGPHQYHIMYGQFLLPYYSQTPGMKLLEIGLGCNMRYGPGASVAVWKKLFPHAELWEAEYDAACVEKSIAEGKLNGINALTGDQMNLTTLDEWINLSGGANFDVVIDDGGHKQCMIWTSFLKLWPLLKPGGLYFVEDLQVSRQHSYSDVSSPLCDISTNVVDKLKDILDALVHRRGNEIDIKDVKFIFCQRDSCVLGKH